MSKVSQQDLHAIVIESGRRFLIRFAKLVDKKLVASNFHKDYYKLLDQFVKGRIKKLIISAPPQHGKSTGSTIYGPAKALGVRPDAKIVIASYSASLATKFSRAIRRIMSTNIYRLLYPDSYLAKVTESEDIRRQDEFETAKGGSLKAVGRGGGLTGNPVDILFMDDLYSGPEEANSPTIRENAWEWYTDVARTRLHNDSQELIVFTRWHEEDIVGKLQGIETMVEVDWMPGMDIEQIVSEHEARAKNVWLKVNFMAILPGNMALFPEKHSIEKLQDSRRLDPVKFDALYQGNPTSKDSVLYSGFKVYESLPATVYGRYAYIDPAGRGTDYTCAICWVEDSAGIPYVIDIIYDDRGGEFTELAVAAALDRSNVSMATFEANNGGENYSRAVKKLLRTPIRVLAEAQTKNKESKIITEAPRVMELLHFPEDWATRWPAFYAHMTKFRRKFSANKHDDGADACTEVVMRCKAYKPGVKFNTRR